MLWLIILLAACHTYLRVRMRPALHLLHFLPLTIATDLLLTQRGFPVTLNTPSTLLQQTVIVLVVLNVTALCAHRHLRP